MLLVPALKGVCLERSVGTERTVTVGTCGSLAISKPLNLNIYYYLFERKLDSAYLVSFIDLFRKSLNRHDVFLRFVELS